MSAGRNSRIVLCCTIVLGFGSCASGAWLYSGVSLQDDFNSAVFPGWNTGLTGSKPFDAADHFLGPETIIGLGFMDFVDDLQGESRFVDITYESIDPDSVLDLDAGPLTVTLNGAAFSSGLRSLEPARYGVSVPSENIDFSGGCCGDLDISFSNPEGRRFGLDNVVIDWSRPVPELSSLSLTIAIGVTISLLAAGKACLGKLDTT